MTVKTASPLVLAQVSLFGDLSPEELKALANCLQRRRYAKGQIIFQRGDPGTSLYLVEEGRVKVINTSPEGKGLMLNTFGRGDFFGELKTESCMELLSWGVLLTVTPTNGSYLVKYLWTHSMPGILNRDTN